MSSETIQEISPKPIMNFSFESPFHKGVVEVHKELKTNPSFFIQKVLFPQLSFLTSGDEFFYKIWNIVDSSKDYVWIIIYNFDSTHAANTTLKKLTEAAKRGVQVTLLIDDLANWASKPLLDEFKLAGGTYVSLNMLVYFWKIANKEFFRRHHEKIIISDSELMIGSANISGDYGGRLTGNYEFRDLNLSMKNLLLEKARETFLFYGNTFGFRLSSKSENKELSEKYSRLYPSSSLPIHSGFKSDLLLTCLPEKSEIQDWILDQMAKAKKSIRIIAPYYYPYKEFEDAAILAKKRGVEVEIITARKRDQPAYAKLKNAVLAQRLQMEGIKVYEANDKLIHIKGYLFDDRLLTTGSFNNDLWSWTINNELNVVLESEEVAEMYKGVWNKIKSQSSEVNRFDTYTRLSLPSWILVKWWEFFVDFSTYFSTKKYIYEADTKRKRRMLRMKEFRDKQRHEMMGQLKESQYYFVYTNGWDEIGSKF